MCHGPLRFPPPSVGSAEGLYEKIQNGDGNSPLALNFWSRELYPLRVKMSTQAMFLLSWIGLRKAGNSIC